MPLLMFWNAKFKVRIVFKVWIKVDTFKLMVCLHVLTKASLRKVNNTLFSIQPMFTEHECKLSIIMSGISRLETPRNIIHCIVYKLSANIRTLRTEGHWTSWTWCTLNEIPELCIQLISFSWYYWAHWISVSSLLLNRPMLVLNGRY